MCYSHAFYVEIRNLNLPHNFNEGSKMLRVNKQIERMYYSILRLLDVLDCFDTDCSNNQRETRVTNTLTR